MPDGPCPHSLPALRLPTKSRWRPSARPLTEPPSRRRRAQPLRAAVGPASGGGCAMPPSAPQNVRGLHRRTDVMPETISRGAGQGPLFHVKPRRAAGRAAAVRPGVRVQPADQARSSDEITPGRCSRWPRIRPASWPPRRPSSPSRTVTCLVRPDVAAGSDGGPDARPSCRRNQRQAGGLSSPPRRPRHTPRPTSTPRGPARVRRAGPRGARGAWFTIAPVRPWHGRRSRAQHKARPRHLLQVGARSVHGARDARRARSRRRRRGGAGSMCWVAELHGKATPPSVC